MHGMEFKGCIFSSGAYFYSMFEINFRFEGIFSREEVGPSKDIFPAMKSSKDWRSWLAIQVENKFKEAKICTKLLDLSPKR